MRSRNIQKCIYLNKKENDTLKEKVKILKKSETEFIRELILGYVHDNNLSIGIHNIIYELRKIGNNINQIAYVANSKGIITKYNLEEELNKLNKIIKELEEKYFR